MLTMADQAEIRLRVKLQNAAKSSEEKLTLDTMRMHWIKKKNKLFYRFHSSVNSKQ
jgi:hypothetical protein